MLYCFVTEADLDRLGVGGVVTDLQVLQCLRDLGEIDVIHLQRIRYRSTPLALLVFLSQILKSLGKPYKAYFSRGLISSLLLSVLDSLTLRRRKIVHRALSVPFASKEVRFLGFGTIESLLRYAIFLWIEHFVYSRAHAITIASETYERELLRAGIEKDRIFITNFIVERGFFRSPIHKVPCKLFRYCYVGGFHLYQDLQPMIEAFELLSEKTEDVELILVGDGLQRPKLEEEVNKKRLAAKVRFAGRLPHTAVSSFLSEIDCFISLTRKPGLSISVVEAAAMGKPIIAFAQGDMSTYNDYFHHLEEIYLVNSLAPDDIAAAMQLLYSDTRLRNTLAKGARKVAKEHFDQAVASRQFEALLRKLN